MGGVKVRVSKSVEASPDFHKSLSIIRALNSLKIEERIDGETEEGSLVQVHLEFGVGDGRMDVSKYLNFLASCLRGDGASSSTTFFRGVRVLV